ncbi:DUF5590 domain-containing protein [Paenibacillus tarimensis]
MRSKSKAPSLMTPWRWALISTMLLIIIFLLLNIYYRSIQAPVWAEQNQAIAIASEAAQLDKVIRVDKHVWDTTTWVVQGINAEQKEVYVWVTDETTAVIPASEGIKKSVLQANVLAAKPDIRITRITPGLLRGERVWEVFYSREENVTRYYYEFYRFSDGSFITIYNLPAKFSDGP